MSGVSREGKTDTRLNTNLSYIFFHRRFISQHITDSHTFRKHLIFTYDSLSPCLTASARLSGPVGSFCWILHGSWELAYTHIMTCYDSRLCATLWSQRRKSNDPWARHPQAGQGAWPWSWRTLGASEPSLLGQRLCVSEWEGRPSGLVGIGSLSGEKKKHVYFWRDIFSKASRCPLKTKSTTLGTLLDNLMIEMWYVCPLYFSDKLNH